MYAARVGKVCLDRVAVAQVALDSCIELVTLRNSQGRIETTRKIRVQHAKLADQLRLAVQLLRKAEMLGDKHTSLIGSHELACRRIAQLIRVEEELLFTKREVVDGAQQWSIEEDAATASEHKLA